MLKDKRILLSLPLIVILLILIILIKNGFILKIDNQIYNFIAQFINDANTKIFKVITFFGSTLFIVIITLVLACLYGKRRGGIIILTMLISTLINNAIKLLIARPRPTILQLVTEKSFSFPSGHTMAVTSLCGIIFYLILKDKNKHKRRGIAFKIILCLIPYLIMLSRIYLGIHYFSDCLGGYIVSIILLLIITYFIDKKALL